MRQTARSLVTSKKQSPECGGWQSGCKGLNAQVGGSRAFKALAAEWAGERGSQGQRGGQGSFFLFFIH